MKGRQDRSEGIWSMTKGETRGKRSAMHKHFFYGILAYRRCHVTLESGYITRLHSLRLWLTLPVGVRHTRALHFLSSLNYRLKLNVRILLHGFALRIEIEYFLLTFSQ